MRNQFYEQRMQSVCWVADLLSNLIDLTKSFRRNLALPVTTEKGCRPKSQKDHHGEHGKQPGGHHCPPGRPLYGQAILFGANGHAFKAANAFWRAYCHFLADLDPTRTLPVTFSAVDAVVRITIDPQRAKKRKEAQQRTVWTEESTPEIGNNKRDGHQKKKDGQGEIGGSKKKLEHFGVCRQIVRCLQKGGDCCHIHIPNDYIGKKGKEKIF